MNRYRPVATTAALVLVTGLMAGCSGDDEKSAAPRATVIAPGRPGEPNKTVTVGPTSPAPPSAADIEFIQMMIPHHQQALEMSVLAPGQAADPKVKALAERIDAGQGAEISALQSWLRRHAPKPTGGHGGHGAAPSASSSHAGMAGMATPQEMAQLQAARGEAFDRLYLTLMIKHHDGALTMARQVLAQSTDVQIQQIAKDVITTQQAEIVRMRDIQRAAAE